MPDVSLDDLIQQERAQNRGKFQAKPRLYQPPAERGNRPLRGGFKDPRTRFIQKPLNANRPYERRDNTDWKSKSPQPDRPPQQRQALRNDRPAVETHHESQEVKDQQARTLKIMGLHPDLTNADLYKMFSAQGALQKCLIEQDDFGRNQPTAIVRYHSLVSAQSAIRNLNQHREKNSVLTVEPYRFQKRGGKY